MDGRLRAFILFTNNLNMRHPVGFLTLSFHYGVGCLINFESSSARLPPKPPTTGRQVRRLPRTHGKKKINTRGAFPSPVVVFLSFQAFFVCKGACSSMPYPQYNRALPRALAPTHAVTVRTTCQQLNFLAMYFPFLDQQIVDLLLGC